jgi:hypothetical protein
MKTRIIFSAIGVILLATILLGIVISAKAAAITICAGTIILVDGVGLYSLKEEAGWTDSDTWFVMLGMTAVMAVVLWMILSS